MGNAVIEKHIFTGCAGIPKAIADIEAKGNAIRHAGSGAPIPGVFIGPYTPAPIQHGKGMGRGEEIFISVPFRLALRPEAIDLLIIIEGLGILRKAITMESRGTSVSVTSKRIGAPSLKSSMCP